MTAFQSRDFLLDCGCGIGVPPTNENDHGRDGHATQVFLDPQEAVDVRQGASLPHWTQDGATYAVTFRLADSLPAGVLQQWKSEREKLLESSRVAGRELSSAEQASLAELYSERIEAFLDAGEGRCWMRDPRIAGIVSEALRHFDGDRYVLHAWCVMPNHVHAVLKPARGHQLQDILHSWKSFTAHKANEILGLSGEFWQAESFDRLLRDGRDFHNQCDYVLANPSKAGLVGWPWVGCGIGVPPMSR
jgi:REP element-mobilizing transposase RayT